MHHNATISNNDNTLFFEIKFAKTLHEHKKQISIII